MSSISACVRRALSNAGVKDPEGMYGIAESLFTQLMKAGESMAVAEMRVTMMMQGHMASLSSSSSQHQQGGVAAKTEARTRGEVDENLVDEEIEAEVFSTYSCRSLEGVDVRGVTHPGDIAEAGLLASVRLPELTYCPRALAGCAARGALSDLQLEGALHACQRHAAVVNGTRAGFFLGDGAGVGKGRQIGAVILDSVARGPRVAKGCFTGTSTRVWSDHVRSKTRAELATPESSRAARRRSLERVESASRGPPPPGGTIDRQCRWW